LSDVKILIVKDEHRLPRMVRMGLLRDVQTPMYVYECIVYGLSPFYFFSFVGVGLDIFL
jgi:hypothetical protein